MTILKEVRDKCLILTFNHEKTTNPFSIEMMKELISAMKEAETCEETNAVVLYGGDDRSFSAGGDFSQVLQLGTFEDISAMLHLIVDLYAEILKVTKPVISAIDNYAIGMGFQIALLTDYRIATPETKFLMPELKNGIACTLGGILLEYMIGRKLMMDICYDCEKLPIKKCKKWGIVNEITKEDLIQKAIDRANYYGSFPNKAFRNTKYVNNLRYVEHLESVRELTVEAHYKTLSNRKHVEYMESVINKKLIDHRA